MSDSQPPAGAWTPDGVIRIITEAERAGVTHLRLDVASAGLTLDLTRGSAASDEPLRPSGSGSAAAPSDGLVTITAPVLGTFYHRRSPEEAPLVRVGQAVTTGDLIGLIEVMKTYHEITAPADGTIADILAEDGHYVEYGQALVTLRPAR